tara:strand:+ start:456 stop:755 length:300 start_codon:yes stop_codon:yes gene_type:complete
MSYKCISLDEAQFLLGHPDTVIVDIRDRESYEDGSIPKSINISAENIDNFLEKTDREINLLVYCYVGNSSKGASEYFVQNGFKTVFSLDGGYEEYAREK